MCGWFIGGKLKVVCWLFLVVVVLGLYLLLSRLLVSGFYIIRLRFLLVSIGVSLCFRLWLVIV